VKLCEIIKHTQPQPATKLICKNKKCHFVRDSWQLTKEERSIIEENYRIKKKVTCPNCGSEEVTQPYFNLLLPLKGLEENYRINILCVETGIIESKTFSQLPKEYKDKVKDFFDENRSRGCKFICLGENAPN